MISWKKWASEVIPEEQMERGKEGFLTWNKRFHLAHTENLRHRKAALVARVNWTWEQTLKLLALTFNCIVRQSNQWMTGLRCIYTAADEYSNGDRCASSEPETSWRSYVHRQKGKLKGNTGGDHETSGYTQATNEKNQCMQFGLFDSLAAWFFYHQFFHTDFHWNLYFAFFDTIQGYWYLLLLRQWEC